MTLILELPDGKEAVLKDKAQAHGVSAEQFAQQLLDQALDEMVKPAVLTAHHRHISEVIQERMSKMPIEVWAALPPDCASEHDHYIYGLPKKNV